MMKSSPMFRSARNVPEPHGITASTISDGTIITTFTSDGEQTTVYFEAFYTVPIPLLGKIAEALIQGQNQREVELMLANLKTRMEA